MRRLSIMARITTLEAPASSSTTAERPEYCHTSAFGGSYAGTTSTRKSAAFRIFGCDV